VLVCKQTYFRENVEEFITQLKNNRFVRYSVLSGFVLLAYLLGGAVAILIAVCGLVLGRLSYNDVIDDLDI
jgi:putative exporter of polyketide antibiotics|tara:strand:- start:162 stop:374 length:213 start_codon:yes stop_codon:yes gene_type:complete